eukprot:CAMPEP_0198303878 /NCGR_PEP_ID=MMETSP1449-20131203/57113_1 /TAXON_ID=420275 /ORGANISM="Attheya septentrionalis, Strain CCMP2084" /LENGTH=887 /DNA_ID=CAMNT_0044006385 /DNA_START=658 /DNA_END=3321 /DNA_ORIENTATION=-
MITFNYSQDEEEDLEVCWLTQPRNTNEGNGLLFGSSPINGSYSVSAGTSRPVVVPSPPLVVRRGFDANESFSRAGPLHVRPPQAVPPLRWGQPESPRSNPHQGEFSAHHDQLHTPDSEILERQPPAIAIGATYPILRTANHIPQYNSPLRGGSLPYVHDGCGNPGVMDNARFLFRPFHLSPPHDRKPFSVSHPQDKLRPSSTATTAASTSSSPCTLQRSPATLYSPSSRVPRPDSTTTVESFESVQSQSSYGSQSPGRKTKKKRNSRRKGSVSSTVDTCEPSNDLDSNETSPKKALKPRGDKFREAKVKTVLCNYYKTGKACPFRSECLYAHGDDELKYTKLMAMENAGLVDVETFRTHPCLTWIATGACPFDSKCELLHDPRAAGSIPPWLPNVKTSINNDISGSNTNVDELYHHRYSSLYSCSPLYGYVPLRRWKADESHIREAWAHFYSFVCSTETDPKRSRNDIHQDDFAATRRTALNGIVNSVHPKYLSEFHQLWIALVLRRTRAAQSYLYAPTHTFMGELCMVLESRMFQIEGDNEGLASALEFGKLHEIKYNTAQSHSRLHSSSSIIIVVHSIAFGPVGDPSVPGVALWFNIPDGDLVQCTVAEAKKSKRSHHRLRKKARSSPIRSSLPNSNDATSPKHLGFKRIESSGIPMLHIHEPLDDCAFDLVTQILMHRMGILSLEAGRLGDKPEVIKHGLDMQSRHLKSCFESQRRYWMTWSWPVNPHGSVGNETDAPPIDGVYICDTNYASFKSELFHGADDGVGEPVLERGTKRTLEYIWKSFTANQELLRSGTALQKQEETPKKPLSLLKPKRLPFFRSLTQGLIRRGKTRRLPHIIGQGRNGSKQKGNSIIELLKLWEPIMAYYSKKPWRKSQAIENITE